MQSFLVSVFVIATSFCGVISIGPGDSCTRDNKPGTCIGIYDCFEVIQGIQQNKPPPPACYRPSEGPHFVCCLDKQSTASTTNHVTEETTTHRQAPVEEKLARRKCREYARHALKTIVSPALVEEPMITVDSCIKSAEQLIVGGVEARLGEFPHMALLGYGDDDDELSYSCGGSLISERYVLTASHCVSDRVPSHVLFGELILHNDTDGAETQLIPIASDRGIILHPQYNDESHYYDIALIRLAHQPVLGPRVRPACLHTGTPYGPGSLIASGWGTLEWGGDRSEALMKVNLNEIKYGQCSRAYRNLGSTLTDGIRDDQQICAGVLDGGKDTCQGDSGGPLQIFKNDPHCTYDIVGVVSFGKGCALKGTPGVYVRVQNFVDWIEAIVWPGFSR